MNIQEIIAILIGISCIIWVGTRIYRTFSGIKDLNDPCSHCVSGCELRNKLKEKQRSCNKKQGMTKKSCCE